MGILSRQIGAVVSTMAKQPGTVENLGLSSCMKREEELGKRTGSLDDSLLNVIDETLKHVFKETGAKVVYDYLKDQCHLKREEIAEKPEVFSAGLERLLKSGAVVIEKVILKKLSSKLQLKYEEKERCEFSDYIEELEEKFGC
jgi:6-pyruvoyl-tetrahydropterin synthase